MARPITCGEDVVALSRRKEQKCEGYDVIATQSWITTLDEVAVVGQCAADNTADDASRGVGYVLDGLDPSLRGRSCRSYTKELRMLERWQHHL
jgi:hypothetical protein